ncbi:MAG: YqhA family protein [Gammaproteobacteria bacterium]
MIERIFQGSRFLVLIAVLVSAVSAVMLYAASLNILVHALLDYVQEVPRMSDEGKSLAVKLLKLLDLLLIAITFQLLAVSLYRLFITPLRVEESKFLGALQIKNFHDLKITLIQVAVVIMVILFLEQAVEIGPTLETLYFGAGIALVMLAAVFAWKNMR